MDTTKNAHARAHNFCDADHTFSSNQPTAKTNFDFFATQITPTLDQNHSNSSKGLSVCFNGDNKTKCFINDRSRTRENVYHLDSRFCIGNDSAHNLYNSIETELKTFLNHKRIDNGKNQVARMQHRKYKQALSTICAGLFQASRKNLDLAVSRNTGKTSRSLIDMQDFFTHKGYCSMVKGIRGELSKTTTLLTPHASFDYLVKLYDLKVRLVDNAYFIKIKSKKNKDGESKELPLPTDYHGTRTLNRMNNEVTLYINNMLEHTVTHGNELLFPSTDRIFNNGTLNNGGRMYGGDHLQLAGSKKAHHTGLTKYRKDIFIDGETVIEPDYKHLHPSLVYWMAGSELSSDPYVVDGYSRKAIKLAFLILLNVSSKAALVKAVNFSSNPDNIAKYDCYIKERKTYANNLMNGIITPEPKPPFGIWAYDATKKTKFKKVSEHLFIHGFEPNTDGNALVNAILAKHQTIEPLLFTKTLGVELQRIDSDIMAKVLAMLAAQNRPALPVHDSIVVKRSDINHAITAMQEAYQAVTGQTANIDF